MVSRTVYGQDAIDSIDADLIEACAHRENAWKHVVFKDSAEHRAAYDAACSDVDTLLDLRHEMQAGEGPLAY